jgi:hypothetical protein
MKIAFGYKAGSGKDLCVKYLIKKYGGYKIAFSDPLYDILHYAQNKCGFRYEKDRKFLQFIGTEWARSINDNVWIDILLYNSSKLENCYCSDVRFINEFEALRSNGWTLIKLDRNHIDSRRIGSGNSNHISENQLDSYNNYRWDYVISNNGSIKELYENLDTIVNSIQLEKRIIDDINKILE